MASFDGPRREGLQSFRALEHPASASEAPVAIAAAPALRVNELSVSFATPAGEIRAVDGVSFELARKQVLAIVGESGSGKSVCAMTLMGLTRAPNVQISGSAQLGKHELIGASEAALRRVRGAELAMIFQDPQSSLNPVHRVGEQIAEQIRAHEPLVSREQARERAAALMARVGISRPGFTTRELARAYPHELSGGMRQRVMIAMALSLGAGVLLADEPTTALDVTVQARILAELVELREREELSIVLITHDFGVVAGIADRVAVMRSGRIVEQGLAEQVLEDPQHPYTQGLLSALSPPTRPRRPRLEPRAVLEVEELRVAYGRRARRGRRAGSAHEALAGVTLSVRGGETLAIVGESGSGKTTLLRAIAGLLEPSAGAVRLHGRELAGASRGEREELRRGLGMVFQDPHASLNPRRRVGATLERALRAHGYTRAEGASRARRLLERVGLPAGYATRFPHELSGGERQRVGIARALAGKQRIVLLDEPVSSLDASIRRGVIELLAELQSERGCAYVLVSHDFTTVEAIADRIAVMRAGELIELGEAQELIEHPSHPYTRELLAACPRLPGDVRSARWTTQPGSFSG